MEIKETVVEKKVYVVNGCEFDTKEEAEKYISKYNEIMKNIHYKTYYHVHGELNNKGEYQEESLISTNAESKSLNVLLDYLIHRFGYPLTLIAENYLETYTIKGPLKFSELENSTREIVLEGELKLHEFQLKSKGSIESIKYVHLKSDGTPLR